MGTQYQEIVLEADRLAAQGEDVEPIRVQELRRAWDAYVAEWDIEPDENCWAMVGIPLAAAEDASKRREFVFTVSQWELQLLKFALDIARPRVTHEQRLAMTRLAYDFVDCESTGDVELTLNGPEAALLYTACAISTQEQPEDATSERSQYLEMKRVLGQQLIHSMRQEVQS